MKIIQTVLPVMQVLEFRVSIKDDDLAECWAETGTPRHATVAVAFLNQYL
jgi:hypothetical protein